MSKNDPTYVLTGEVRLSFPSLFKMRPKSPENPDKLTYQCTILIPPNEDLKVYQAAAHAAMKAKWGKILPYPLGKEPVKPCERKEGLAGYEPGWHFISMHSNDPVAVVDRFNTPVTDPSLVYPGMWVRAYINAFAWEHKQGGKSVSFGFRAIQLVRDGDRLDSRAPVKADDVFAPLEPLEDETAVDPLS